MSQRNKRTTENEPRQERIFVPAVSDYDYTKRLTLGAYELDGCEECKSTGKIVNQYGYLVDCRTCNGTGEV